MTRLCIFLDFSRQTAVSIDSSQIWRTDLVVLVAQTEVLQELVGQPHQLVHPHVLLGIKRNLQQVQDHLEPGKLK